MATHSRHSQVRDATSLIRARHRAKIRRRVIHVAIPVAVLLLAVAVVWVVWFSSLFVAQSIRVTGNSQASTDEIIQAAHIHLGTPLARLDPDAICDDVKQVPAVADATVDRNLSGVITISVTERTAVYVIPSGAQYLLVDDTGKAFLTVEAVPEGLPVVTLKNDHTPAADRLLADAAQIAQALPDSVRGQMTSMGAETPDTFTITLSNGSQILWGSADECELKATVIDALLNVGASYYDVSSPSHPSTR